MIIFRLLFLFTAIILFSSCEKGDIPSGTDWEEGVVYFTGEVAVDGCGWLVLSEGESFHPEGLPEGFQVDGLDVWFKSDESKDSFICGLGATVYEVKKIRNITEKPWALRFLSDYPGRETSMDMFNLDTVYIENDSLHMHVGYSGGCAIHQFNLWALETGLDKKGDIHIMLEHISNGDLCEAYLMEWLSFSLKPLQKKGQNEVLFMMRGSPIMSMLYGPYTYRY